MYEERLVPLASDSGGLGKYGGVGTFLVNGLQIRLLADQNGPRITTVHGLHGGEPWVLRVYPHAVQAVQRTGNIPASHAEHLGGAEPHICVIYLDDVIVYGHMEEEHLKHLHMVFERFREAFKVLILPVRKLCTWPITSHRGTSYLVRRMCGPCRNSQCPRLTRRSAHFAD